MTGEGWAIDSETGDHVLDQHTARAIRGARLAAGLTQVNLGIVAGCSAGVVSALENSRAVPILDTAWRIVKSLVLPESTRRAVIEAATREPGETSVYERCGWTVDVLRHPNGRVEVCEVTPILGPAAPRARGPR